MARFLRLEELAVAATFWALFNGTFVYFERETTMDVEFAASLHNLWVELLDHTNERQLFITKFKGLRPSVMMYKVPEFLQKVQKHNVFKLLEHRKMIAETYGEVHKKIDFVSVIRAL
ncbi:hypothetical protein Tco_0673939 [Tanacetum coccineum]